MQISFESTLTLTLEEIPYLKILYTYTQITKIQLENVQANPCLENEHMEILISSTIIKRTETPIPNIILDSQQQTSDIDLFVHVCNACSCLLMPGSLT